MAILTPMTTARAPNCIYWEIRVGISHSRFAVIPEASVRAEMMVRKDKMVNLFFD